MNAKRVQHPTEVLIVGNGPTQAEQLKHLLEKANYRVVLAPDGHCALQALEKHQANLFISDIVMPVMTAIKCAGASRPTGDSRESRLFWLPRLPILAK